MATVKWGEERLNAVQPSGLDGAQARVEEAQTRERDAQVRVEEAQTRESGAQVRVEEAQTRERDAQARAARLRLAWSTDPTRASDEESRAAARVLAKEALTWQAIAALPEESYGSDEEKYAAAAKMVELITGEDDWDGRLWNGGKGFKTGADYLRSVKETIERGAEGMMDPELREWSRMTDEEKDARVEEERGIASRLGEVAGVTAGEMGRLVRGVPRLTKDEYANAPENVRAASDDLGSVMADRMTDEERRGRETLIHTWRNGDWERMKRRLDYEAKLRRKNALLYLPGMIAALGTDEAKELAGELARHPERMPPNWAERLKALPVRDIETLAQVRGMTREHVEGDFLNWLGDAAIGVYNGFHGLFARGLGQQGAKHLEMAWNAFAPQDWQIDIDECARRRNALWSAYAGWDSPIESISDEHGAFANFTINLASTVPFVLSMKAKALGFGACAAEAMSAADQTARAAGLDTDDPEYAARNALMGGLYAYCLKAVSPRFFGASANGAAEEIALRTAFMKGVVSGCAKLDTLKVMSQRTASGALTMAMQQGIAAINDGLNLGGDAWKDTAERFTEAFASSIPDMLVFSAHGVLEGHAHASGGWRKAFTAEGRANRSASLRDAVAAQMALNMAVRGDGLTAKTMIQVRDGMLQNLYRAWTEGGERELRKLGLKDDQVAEARELFEGLRERAGAARRLEEADAELAGRDARLDEGAATEEFDPYEFAERNEAARERDEAARRLDETDAALRGRADALLGSMNDGRAEVGNLAAVRNVWAEGNAVGAGRTDGTDAGAAALVKAGFAPEDARSLSRAFGAERRGMYSPEAAEALRALYERSTRGRVAADAALARAFGGRVRKAGGGTFIDIPLPDGGTGTLAVETADLSRKFYGEAGSDPEMARQVEAATRGKANEVKAADWIRMSDAERREVVENPQNRLVYEGDFELVSPDDPTLSVSASGAANLVGRVTIDPMADPGAGFHEVMHGWLRFCQETGFFDEADVKWLQETYGKPGNAKEQLDEESAADRFRRYCAARAAGAAAEEAGPWRKMYALARRMMHKAERDAATGRLAANAEQALYDQILAGRYAHIRELKFAEPAAPKAGTGNGERGTEAPQTGAKPKEPAKETKATEATTETQPVASVPDVPAVPSASRVVSFEALTPTGGKKVRGHYEIVPLASLLHSNKSGYPMDLQQRDRRDNKGEEQTREDHIANFEAGYLLADPKTDSGAMVVARRPGPDGKPQLVVVSGNGRTMVLEEMAKRNLYDKYRNRMKEWAAQNVVENTVADADNPVLIRVVDDLGGATLKELADLSNTNAIQQMNEEETARADADLVRSLDLARLYRPNMDGSANMAAGASDEFFRAFVRATGDTSLLNSDGTFTEALRMRARRALLAIACGQGARGRDVVKKLVEDTDALGIDRQKDAAAAIAPHVAAAEARPEYAIGPDVSRAFADYIEFRENRDAGKKWGTLENYLKQGDMLDQRSEIAEAVMRLLDDSKGAPVLAETVRLYTEAAKGETDGLFGAARTRAEIWRDAAKAVDEKAAQERARNEGFGKTRYSITVRGEKDGKEEWIDIGPRQYIKRTNQPPNRSCGSDPGLPGATEEHLSRSAACRAIDSLGSLPNLAPRVKTATENFKQMADAIASGKPPKGLRNPVTAENFLGTLTAFGFTKQSPASAYLVLPDVSIRISDHAGDADRFKKDSNWSIVLESHRFQKPFNAGKKKKNVVEFKIRRDYLKDSPEKLLALLQSMSEFAVNGEIHDTVGALGYKFSGSDEYVTDAIERLKDDARAREDMDAVARLNADLPAFKKNFFGDWENDPKNASKVVDEKGRPLVVYRGAPFDPLAQKPGEGVIKPEAYFTADPEYAKRYAGSEGAVRAYYLNIRHPFDIRRPECLADLKKIYPDHDFVRGKSGALDWAEAATVDGEFLRDSFGDKYDGIIYDEGGDPGANGVSYRGISYVPIKGGKRVKSATDNNGAFSENPDVRFSISGVYTGTAADYANRSRQGGKDDGPSLLKIGTGEGSQVYGWGLYGSTVRGVAEGYAKDAREYNAEKNGKRIDLIFPKNMLEAETAKRLMENGGDVRKTIEKLKRKGIGSAIIKELEEHGSEYSVGPKHEQLYEQTFFTDRAPGDESHLLKWYEPVSEEQFAVIGKAGLDVEEKRRTVDGETIRRVQISKDGELLLQAKDKSEITGQDLYGLVAKALGTPQAASEFLARAGIDGVKYPVDSYGGKGVKDGDKVGWNYVSFRDDNIRVDHKWTDGQQRYSIAGNVGAANMGIKGAAEAEAMEKAGKDREEIWRTTGWWRGSDGKWRVEIPDFTLKMETIGKEANESDPDYFVRKRKLSDIITDTQLFDAYPELKKITVQTPHHDTFGDGGVMGDYNGKRQIRLNMWAMQYDPESVRKTLAYEIQHAIQRIEGFAKGGNEGQFKEADPWAMRRKAKAERLLGHEAEADRLEAEAEEIEENALEGHVIENGEVYENTFEAYQSLAGETESRNVEQRLAMSPEERAATPPWATEDVPDYRQIVRYSITGGNALATAKLGEWKKDVDDDSVRGAIADYIDKGALSGNIRLGSEGEKLQIAIAANQFFKAYSDKIVMLSDGRCAYFAPDTRNRERGLSNAECWAIYCVHAVTHGGEKVKGKSWNERIWSPEKAESMLLIEQALKDERCRAIVNNRDPSRDRVLFIGRSADGTRMDVMTSLDEYGNINADLTEVTVVMGGGEVPSTDYSPLTRAVEIVALHQADGYSVSTQKSVPKPSDEIKADPEAFARRSLVARVENGAKEEKESALVAFVAERALRNGPKPDAVRTLARIGLELGLPAVDAKQIIRKGEALAERVRGTVIEKAAQEGAVGTAAALLAREADIDRLVAGAAGAGGRLVKAGEGKIKNLLDREIEKTVRSFNAATLADVERDTSIDIAGEILANSPEKFDPKRGNGKRGTGNGEPEAGNVEDGFAPGASAPDGEGLSDYEIARRQRVRKEAEERVAKMIATAKERSEAAKREREEWEAKREERRRRAEEAAASGEDGGGESGEGGGEGGGEGAAPGDRPKLSTFADFKTPEEFAAFFRVWAEDRYKKEHGASTLGKHEEKRLFPEFYRKAVVRALQDLADKLLPPKGARATVNRWLGEIQPGVRPETLERMSADVFAYINRNAIRESRTEMVRKFRKELKPFAAGAKFEELKMDSDRKVSGWAEEAARYIRRVCELSDREINGRPSQLAEERARLQEILDRREKVYDDEGRDAADAPKSDMETRRALAKLQLLEKYGAMKRLMPGEIADLAEEAVRWLNDEAGKLEEAWRGAREAEEGIRAALVGGIVGPDGGKYARAKGFWGAADRLFDSMNGMIRLRLQHLVRFADGAGQQKAKDAINRVVVMLGDGETAFARHLQDDRAAFHDALARIFARPEGGGVDRRALADWLNRMTEEIPKELSRRLSKQGYGESMTYGQMLQLLVSLEQRSYAEAIEANGRAGQAELIRTFEAAGPDGVRERVLTDRDILFIDWLRSFYEAKRGMLSEVTKRMTGLPIDSPDPNYCPVKMYTGDKARGMHVDSSAAWDPIGAVFSRRIRNRRDFDESASILGQFFDRSAEAAKLVAWGERGSIIRGVFTDASVQESVRRAFGGGELSKILKQLEETFNGGEGVRKAPGEIAAMDKAMNWMTYLSLGYNPLSAAKQTTSFTVWANALPGGFKDLWRYMTDVDMETIRHIRESDEYKVRYGNEVGSGHDVATKGVFENPSENPLAAFFRKTSMGLLRKGDFLPGGWIAQGLFRDLYNRHLKEGMDAAAADRLAMTETFNMLEETQQSGRTYNTQELVREHGRLGRLLVQFATSPLQQLQWETQAAREVMDLRRYRPAAPDADFEKRYSEAKGRFIRAAVINHVLLPAALHAVTDIYRLAMGQEPEWEKEGWHWSMLRDVVMGQASRITFLGTLGTTLWDAAVTGKVSFSQTDILPVEGLIRSAGQVGKTGRDLVVETWRGMTARDFAEGFDYEKVQKDLDRLLRSSSVTRTPYDVVRRVTGNSDADVKKGR